VVKKDFEEILTVYKDQIGLLREQIRILQVEKTELQKQLFNLQDGLLNIRAPEAYRDLIADRNPEIMNITPEELQRNKQIDKIHREYVANIEQPLFKSADELISILSPALSAKGIAATQSLHENTES